MRNRVLDGKKIFTTSVVVGMLLAMSFGILKFRKVQAYDNMIHIANKCMDEKEYGDAIALYQQSLSYKKDASIEEKIKKAKEIKSQKSSMDDAVKMMNDKKFSEAMAVFEKMTPDNKELYEEAQKNIDECKKQIIDVNLQNAAAAADKGDLSKVKEYVGQVLSLDANNKEALKIKEKYLKDVKKGANTKNR